MSKSPTETTPSVPPSPLFLTLSDTTLQLLGSTDQAAKARVVRMADRGELAVIRIGLRGDRLFLASEIDRLCSEATRQGEDGAGPPTPEKQ